MQRQAAPKTPKATTDPGLMPYKKHHRRERQREPLHDKQHHVVAVEAQQPERKDGPQYDGDDGPIHESAPPREASEHHRQSSERQAREDQRSQILPQYDADDRGRKEKNSKGGECYPPTARAPFRAAGKVVYGLDDGRAPDPEPRREDDGEGDEEAAECPNEQRGGLEGEAQSLDAAALRRGEDPPGKDDDPAGDTYAGQSPEDRGQYGVRRALQEERVDHGPTAHPQGAQHAQFPAASFREHHERIDE